MNGAPTLRLSTTKRRPPVRQEPSKPGLLYRRTPAGSPVDLATGRHAVRADAPGKRKDPVPTVSRIVLRAGVVSFL